MNTIIKVLGPAVIIFSSVGEVYLKKSDEETELHCERESPTADQIAIFNIGQYTGATANSIVLFGR